MKNIFCFLVTFSILLASCGSADAPIAHLPAPELSIVDAPSLPETTPTIEIITLTDASGRDVTITGPPEKIVSLSSAITETLFAIGAGGQVVARDSSSTFPEEVAQVSSMGDLFADFNAATYIGLSPDLVIADDNIPAETIAGLEALGIPAFVLQIPQDVEGLMSNISLLGTLTDHQDGADALLQEMDLQLSAIDLALKNVEESPLVFYELEASDPNAPWTIGEGTILDEILMLAGGENAGAAYSGRWVQLPLAELLAIDPEIILLGDAAYGISPDSLTTRVGWEELSAVVNMQIYAFDDRQISDPGPRIVEIIEDLAALLHPDSFD